MSRSHGNSVEICRCVFQTLYRSSRVSVWPDGRAVFAAALKASSITPASAKREVLVHESAFSNQAWIVWNEPSASTALSHFGGVPWMEAERATSKTIKWATMPARKQSRDFGCAALPSGSSGIFLEDRNA
jgi:hypothetical protein